MNLASSVPKSGNIIEVGVFQGRNSLIFTEYIESVDNPTNRKYIGFDTFSGYRPEDLTNDVSEKNKSNLQGMQDVGRWNHSKKEVIDLLHQHKLSSFDIVEGDCKITLPRYLQDNQTSISLLYIDCNAYVPALASMRNSLSYMLKKSIIVIDEHQVGGETKALFDFCAENNFKPIQTNLPNGCGPPYYTIIQ